MEHRTLPTTSGCRYAIVYFTWGIDGEIRLPAGEEMKKKAQMSTIGLNLLMDTNFTDTNFKEGTDSTHAHGHRDMPRFWPRFCLPAQTPRSATDQPLQTQPLTPEEGVAVEESEGMDVTPQSVDPPLCIRPLTPVEGAVEQREGGSDGAGMCGEDILRSMKDNVENGTTDAIEVPSLARVLTPEEGTSHSTEGADVGIEKEWKREEANMLPARLKRKWDRKEEWAAEREETRKKAKLGAILAPSRTEEGYKLASGMQESCFTDATYNGANELDPGAVTCGIDKFRNKSIPELGNERQASWSTITKALMQCNLPFELVDASYRFQTSGPPLLNLLQAPPGVYIVGMCVTIGDKQYKHCVMLSTIPTPGKPYGKIVDNGSSSVPVYIEAADRENKKKASGAFRKLLKQKIKHDPFGAIPTYIYELKRIHP